MFKLINRLSLFLLLILALTFTVSASLSIELNSYNNGIALIQINNLGETQLTNPIIKITNQSDDKRTGPLLPRLGLVLIKSLAPGNYTVNVSTDQGVTATTDIILPNNINQSNHNESITFEVNQRQNNQAKKLLELKNIYLNKTLDALNKRNSDLQSNKSETNIIEPQKMFSKVIILIILITIIALVTIAINHVLKKNEI